jgi:hypothetical protein
MGKASSRNAAHTLHQPTPTRPNKGTISPLADTRHGTWHVFQPTEPRWERTTISAPPPCLLQGARVCRMRRPDRRALDRGLGRKLRSKTR